MSLTRLIENLSLEDGLEYSERLLASMRRIVEEGDDPNTSIQRIRDLLDQAEEELKCHSEADH